MNTNLPLLPIISKLEIITFILPCIHVTFQTQESYRVNQRNTWKTATWEEWLKGLYIHSSAFTEQLLCVRYYFRWWRLKKMKPVWDDSDLILKLELISWFALVIVKESLRLSLGCSFFILQSGMIVSPPRAGLWDNWDPVRPVPLWLIWPWGISSLPLSSCSLATLVLTDPRTHIAWMTLSAPSSSAQMSPLKGVNTVIREQHLSFLSL